jgi:hypothetical protein
MASEHTMHETPCDACRISPATVAGECDTCHAVTMATANDDAIVVLNSPYVKGACHATSDTKG